MSEIEEVRHHIAYKMSCGELKTPVGERMLEALDAGGPPDYPALLEAATFLPPSARCFHTASVDAREAISSEGLRPGASDNWGDKAVGQPIGVYLSAEPDTRGLWSHWNTWDVWEVDVTGLEWQYDRLNPGCWVVDSVPADRLTLVHTDITF